MPAQPSCTPRTELGQLNEGGAVRPILEDVFPLRRAREAYERGLRGLKRGKPVLDVVR